jgi:hypothetical protein
MACARAEPWAPRKTTTVSAPTRWHRRKLPRGLSSWPIATVKGFQRRSIFPSALQLSTESIRLGRIMAQQPHGRVALANFRELSETSSISHTCAAPRKSFSNSFREDSTPVLAESATRRHVDNIRLVQAAPCSLLNAP